jgi:glyoxylase-like metal-dependent hydrolase (beta-lactamase superfamily II)
MLVEVFNDNPYGTNAWVLAAEGSEDAVVIDPGFEPDAVEGILEATGRRLAAILLTHGHVDHAMQAGALAGADVPVWVHPADEVAFTDPEGWRAGFPNPLEPVADLRTFVGGDVLGAAGLEVEVRHTPGHTPGHCCFRLRGADGLLCAGDLVFAGSIGRSDFPNSSAPDMVRSLGWFLELPDDLPVLPGHGPTTTVGRERTTNPFLQGLVA